MGILTSDKAAFVEVRLLVRPRSFELASKITRPHLWMRRKRKVV